MQAVLLLAALLLAAVCGGLRRAEARDGKTQVDFLGPRVDRSDLCLK